MLSVFGGKITTYRRLAEAALGKLVPHLPVLDKPSWTGRVALPGGRFPVSGFDALVADLRATHGWADHELLRRLARAYGTDAREILRDCRSTADLGRHFGATLYEREVRWLMRHEFAAQAQDVLWRRSKLGLRLTAHEQADLDAWMAEALPRAAAA